MIFVLGLYFFIRGTENNSLHELSIVHKYCITDYRFTGI